MYTFITICKCINIYTVEHLHIATKTLFMLHIICILSSVKLKNSNILMIYIFVLAWSKIMSTYSNVDIVKTLNITFLFKMELYQSGVDSYLIQIFKWTLKSWEFIEANSFFPAIFTTLAMFSPN